MEIYCGLHSSNVWWKGMHARAQTHTANLLYAIIKEAVRNVHSHTPPKIELPKCVLYSDIPVNLFFISPTKNPGPICLQFDRLNPLMGLQISSTLAKSFSFRLPIMANGEAQFLYITAQKPKRRLK